MCRGMAQGSIPSEVSLIQQLAGEGSNGVSAGNFEEQYKQLRAMLGGK